MSYWSYLFSGPLWNYASWLMCDKGAVKRMRERDLIKSTVVWNRLVIRGSTTSPISQKPSRYFFIVLKYCSPLHLLHTQTKQLRSTQSIKYSLSYFLSYSWFIFHFRIVPLYSSLRIGRKMPAKSAESNSTVSLRRYPSGKVQLFPFQKHFKCRSANC